MYNVQVIDLFLQWIGYVHILVDTCQNCYGGVSMCLISQTHVIEHVVLSEFIYWYINYKL